MPVNPSLLPSYSTIYIRLLQVFRNTFLEKHWVDYCYTSDPEDFILCAVFKIDGTAKTPGGLKSRAEDKGKESNNFLHFTVK